MKTTTTTSSISEAISQWFTTMIDHLFVFILGCATGRSQFHASFYLEIVTYITHLSDASLPPSQMPAPKTSKGLFSNSNPTGTAKTKSNPGKRYIPTHDVLTIFLDVGRNSLLLCISFDFASCFKLQVFDLFYFCHVTLVCCVLFFFFFFFLVHLVQLHVPKYFSMTSTWISTFKCIVYLVHQQHYLLLYLLYFLKSSFDCSVLFYLFNLFWYWLQITWTNCNLILYFF